MRGRAAAVALAAALLLVPPAPGALAEDTVDLDRDTGVTDRSDVLGDRAAAVRGALERLGAAGGHRLLVVYVRDFSGHEPRSWADAVAERNELGARDLLLAVATRERRHAVSAAVHSGLSAGDLAEVERVAIAPALRRSDWAGAAIGAADGYAAAAAGEPVPAPRLTQGVPDTGDGGGFAVGDWIVPAVLVAVAGLLVAGLIRHAERGLPPEGARTGPAVPELDTQVRGLLIDVDDAVRTRAAELSFDPDPPPAAVAALSSAAAAADAALRARYRLDDPAFHGGRAARRRLLVRAAERCAEARDHLASAPPRDPAGTLDAARERAAALRVRRGSAAAGRLSQATVALHRALRSAAAGDGGAASRSARAAQSALVQAETLHAAVARRSRDRANAIAALRARTTHDTAHGEVPAPIGARPDGDPFDVLRDLVAAGSGDRGPGARGGGARDLLDAALLLARSELAWADALLTAHRESVGSAARLRVAAAARALDEAERAAPGDPAAALRAARRADALAHEAAGHVEHDAGTLV
ncbi:TPM domain-containing protein [Streptomyces sp. RFCAC02]|uniref:TPM domain-containing protein n=1 Tax=Streptomyces sp. RFCAC02 TaxID=2499143 RepID=UPI0010210B10|nr:TPM domain-containing protein [Streptomyces sp. RFCAC02]